MTSIVKLEKSQTFCDKISVVILKTSETEKASENRPENAVVYIRRRQVALSRQPYGKDSQISLFGWYDLLAVALSGPEVMYSLLSREKLDQVLRSLD